MTLIFLYSPVFRKRYRSC